MTISMTPLFGTLPALDPGDLFEGSPNYRAAVLPAGSTDAIIAGMGVDVDTSSYGGYNGAKIKLPTSASGQLAGIVPLDAIPDPITVALNAGTALQLLPSYTVDLFGGEGGYCIVLVQNVSMGDPVYLVYSGASAGKFRKDDAGTQAVYKLTLVSAGAGTIAFSATIGGVAGTVLTRTSTTKAADAANLAAQWNANAYYSAVGVATVDGSDDVVVTGNAYTAISFTDGSGGGNSVTPSTTTALVAPTARRIAGAYWAFAGTAAAGKGFARFPALF